MIHIEFTLNLHLFILVYLLKKNNKYFLENNSDNKRFIKPTILLPFEKIYNDIELNIKSSSILLLLLKLNYKISNIFDYLDDDIILKDNAFINQNNNNNTNDTDNNNITYKINHLLDSFILAIENIYKPHKQEETDSVNNKVVAKYSICMNYIIDLSILSYNYFNLGFEILIKNLQIEYPDKNESFDIIQKTISTFLKNEINILAKTLLE